MLRDTTLWNFLFNPRKADCVRLKMLYPTRSMTEKQKTELKLAIKARLKSGMYHRRVRHKLKLCVRAEGGLVDYHYQ